MNSKRFGAVLTSIALVGLIVMGCSSKEKATVKVEVKQQTINNQPSKEKTQEELNNELKTKAEKADFVKINGHAEETKGLKVFAEGKISVVDYESKMDIFPSFTISQKEGNGLGIYHITNIMGIKGLKDGDTVIIYGILDGTSKVGIPKIVATIIEGK